MNQNTKTRIWFNNASDIRRNSPRGIVCIKYSMFVAEVLHISRDINKIVHCTKIKQSETVIINVLFAGVVKALPGRNTMPCQQDR